MEQVTGQVFGGGAMIETDGKSFANCTFHSVSLVYRGGEHPYFDHCNFGTGVSWRFLGPALRTIQLLQRLGNDQGGEDFIADIFQKGKYFADEGAMPA